MNAACWLLHTVKCCWQHFIFSTIKREKVNKLALKPFLFTSSLTLVLKMRTFYIRWRHIKESFKRMIQGYHISLINKKCSFFISLIEMVAKTFLSISRNQFKISDIFRLCPPPPPPPPPQVRYAPHSSQLRSRFHYILNLGSFPLCPPPRLVGAYYLHPPDARAIFLHNDLLCNDMCSVTGGA